MSEITVLSASRVQEFQSCSLKARFHRDKVKPEFKSGALCVGSSVHASLATGIHSLRSGETRMEELDSSAIFEKAWTEELQGTEVPVKWGAKGEASAKKVAEGLVRAFFDAEDLPERIARIVDLDVKFEIPVVDPTSGFVVPDLKLLGFLDGVERREDGKLRVLEFKTAANLAAYDESSLAVHHVQGAFYVHALRHLHGDDACDDIHFRIGLKKVRSPTWEDRTVTLGEASRRRALLILLNVKRAMELGICFPQPSIFCPCEYTTSCRAWASSPASRIPVDVFAADLLGAELSVS